MLYFTSFMHFIASFMPYGGLYHIQQNVSRGENFAVFTILHSTMNLFLQIMALSISNISLQNCYSKSFTVNSYFPLKTRKFYPTDFFLYTLVVKGFISDIFQICLSVLNTIYEWLRAHGTLMLLEISYMHEKGDINM